MNKRIRILLLALLAVLLLAGCGKNKPLPTGPITMPEASSESGQTGTPEQTEPEAAAPAPILPAVTELSCFAEENYPGIMALGSGKILLVTPIYDVDDAGDSTEYTNVSIVDYYTDAIRTQRFDGTLATPERLYKNGEILLRDFTNNLYIWVDEELNLVKTLPMELGGYFSKDLSVYYYTKDGNFYGKDVASGQESPIKFQWDLYFCDGLGSVHPDKDLFIANVHKDAFSWDFCMAVVRPEDGTIVALTNFDADYSPQLWGDGIYTPHYHWEIENGNEYIYGSLEGTEDMNHIPLSVFGDAETTNTWFIPNSNYMVSGRYDGVDSTLWRIEDEISQCKLEETGFSRYVSDCTALPDGYLAGLYYEPEIGYRLVILNPGEMPFETVCQAEKMARPNMLDAELAQACMNGQKPPQVRPDMAEARALADEMEQEFGVTILISNQCEILQNEKVQSSYDVQTTDQEGLGDEPARVIESLGCVKDALLKYPNGYFQQFRENTGRKGILLALTGQINDGTYNGFEMVTNGWYITAVTAYGPKVSSLAQHELWHATEEKVNQTLGINSDAWNACNPAGFSYDFGESGTAAEFAATDEWTYLDTIWWTEPEDRDPESWYFARAYGKYNDREDRATIMEIIMDPYSEPAADEMMTSSHMRQKVAIMSEAVRNAFDTTGWENVYWERFN